MQMPPSPRHGSLNDTVTRLVSGSTSTTPVAVYVHAAQHNMVKSEQVPSLEQEQINDSGATQNNSKGAPIMNKSGTTVTIWWRRWSRTKRRKRRERKWMRMQGTRENVSISTCCLSKSRREQHPHAAHPSFRAPRCESFLDMNEPLSRLLNGPLCLGEKRSFRRPYKPS